MSEFYQYNLGDKNPSDQYALPDLTVGTTLLELPQKSLVQKDIESVNFVPDHSGYSLSNDGTISAVGFDFSGGTLRAGQTAYDTGVGFWFGIVDGTTPKFSLGDSAGTKITFDGSTLTLPSSTTIGGFTVGSDYIRDTANSFGLASTVTGGDDVRFWAGDTFANRASADFRITESGAVTATSITLTTSGALLEGTVIVNAPLTVSFTAGEAITANDAVSISDGSIYGDTLVNIAGNSNAITIGTGSDGTAEGQKLAQSFTVTGARNIKAFQLSLKRVGSAVNFTASIQGDSAGSPDGTPIQSVTFSSGDFGTGSFNTGIYSFATAAALSGSTTYWFVIERTGGGSDVANYILYNANNGGNPYANGLAKIYKYAATWDNAFGNTTSDIYLQLYESIVGGNVSRASALLNDGRTKNFIGFAKSTVSSGSPVDVVIAGLASLTGLTIGNLYYLSDTFGAISTTPGTTTRKVGIATSSTKLLITNNW